MNASAVRMEFLLEEVERLLKDMDKEELERRRAPGKWSKKEILGHLIDSAVHNLVRFTEAQYGDGPYTVRRYDPDALVRINGYQHVPRKDLLGLWTRLNEQIIRVLGGMGTDVLSRSIKGEGQEEGRTLEWLVRDYIDHMEHHIGQLRN